MLRRPKHVKQTKQEGKKKTADKRTYDTPPLTGKLKKHKHDFQFTQKDSKEQNLETLVFGGERELIDEFEKVIKIRL
jgi:hypothetical protein